MSPLFTATYAEATASLFHLYPAAQLALHTVPVATDGTWAFSGLDAWGHYYVLFTTHFNVDKHPSTIASIAGPLTVPALPAPVAVTVAPVELQIIEVTPNASSSGATISLASARVFDPATAQPVRPALPDGGAADPAVVTISLGAAPVPMPWSATLCGAPAYCAAFPTATAAQPSYTVTALWPASRSDAGSADFAVVSGGEQTFGAAVTSPAGDAAIAIPPDASLDVAWAPQSAADFEVVELFRRQGGSWVSTYTSPSPDDPRSSGEAIPGSAIGDAGTYLINVLFSNARCPASPDAGVGCVVSSLVASQTFVATP